LQAKNRERGIFVQKNHFRQKSAIIWKSSKEYRKLTEKGGLRYNETNTGRTWGYSHFEEVYK
jgi:hypothetical protein